MSIEAENFHFSVPRSYVRIIDSYHTEKGKEADYYHFARVGINLRHVIELMGTERHIRDGILAQFEHKDLNHVAVVTIPAILRQCTPEVSEGNPELNPEILAANALVADVYQLYRYTKLGRYELANRSNSEDVMLHTASAREMAERLCNGRELPEKESSEFAKLGAEFRLKARNYNDMIEDLLRRPFKLRDITHSPDLNIFF